MKHASLATVILAVAIGTVTVTAVPAADPEVGRRKAEPCGACHGPAGNASIPGTPSLAGMPAFYTHWQLIMFRDGRRRDPQMSPFAERLSDVDMADLSAYYAAVRPRARGRPAELPGVAEARTLADAHRCTSCHGPGLLGQQQVPLLAGQDLDYLRKRLHGYKAQTTSDLDGMMTMVAQALTETEIDLLAEYLASLDPATPAAEGHPISR